jgi:hypothetical protein
LIKHINSLKGGTGQESKVVLCGLVNTKKKGSWGDVDDE